MKVGEQALYLALLMCLSTIEAKTALKEWFQKFDITPWWNKTVEDLSKGMAQKVQFITTVLHRPKLLIFDEPFLVLILLMLILLKTRLLSSKSKEHRLFFLLIEWNQLRNFAIILP